MHKRWIYSELFWSAFGLATERYGVSLHIQSKCEKMRTRTTLNTDTFHAVSKAKNSVILTHADNFACL